MEEIRNFVAPERPATAEARDALVSHMLKERILRRACARRMADATMARPSRATMPGRRVGAMTYSVVSDISLRGLTGRSGTRCAARRRSSGGASRPTGRRPPRPCSRASVSTIRLQPDDHVIAA